MGVCPLVSLVHSLAGALFRSLPGRESGPGCGRGRVRERSVPEREGRPARWARTEPGRARGRPERSRAVGRAGGCAGGDGSCSPEPSRAVQAGAVRPALLLVARRGELCWDLTALQPRDGGGLRTSHAPHALRAGSGPEDRGGRRARAVAGRGGGTLRQCPRWLVGGGRSLSRVPPCLFRSRSAFARAPPPQL